MEGKIKATGGTCDVRRRERESKKPLISLVIFKWLFKKPARIGVKNAVCKP